VRKLGFVDCTHDQPIPLFQDITGNHSGSRHERLTLRSASVGYFASDPEWPFIIPSRRLKIVVQFFRLLSNKIIVLFGYNIPGISGHSNGFIRI
jgi:hypothetical protein